MGGGISGLSAARRLRGHYDVTLYEADSRPGGLVKCDTVEGSLFHRTGGHVFNTKREDVAAWFWQCFNRDTEFVRALRRSVISLPSGQEVPYPIENHAYMLGEEVARAVVDDLADILRRGYGEPSDFAAFLLHRFGPTLCRLYFLPYNNKVWQTDLGRIPLSWLEGKLPMPTAEEILHANIMRIEERAFVHSSFYYPRRGGSQFVADRLAEGTSVRCGHRVEHLERREGHWCVDGEDYGHVIFCGNLRDLPAMLHGTDAHLPYLAGIEALKAHGTTTAFCETERNPHSWIYLPDERHRSHRIICTGNFSPDNNAPGHFTSTVEFTGRVDEAEVRRQLALIPYSPRLLALNHAPYTYPVQNADTRAVVTALRGKLAEEHLHLLGRFAEWEYYNMDVAMGAAIDLEARHFTPHT